MAQKLPSGSGSAVDDSGRLLRSRRLVLRRSPRFQRQGKVAIHVGKEPLSETKRRSLASQKTHLKSPPFSLNPEGTAPLKKTQLGFSAESRNHRGLCASVSGSSLIRRRSPRLASKPLPFTLGSMGSISKSEVGSLTETKKTTLRASGDQESIAGCLVHGSESRKRSLRLASRQASRHVEENTDAKENHGNPMLCPPTVYINASKRQKKSMCLTSGLAVAMKKDEILAPNGDCPQSRRRSARLANKRNEADLTLADAIVCCSNQRESKRSALDSSEVCPEGANFGVSAVPTSLEKRNWCIKPVDTPDVVDTKEDFDQALTAIGGQKKSSAMILLGREVEAERRRKREREMQDQHIMVARIETEPGCYSEGWTEEQDMALQRAYFSAKPSPHFWKVVSKMVPGKSAQDCFNRIHAKLVTPPPVPPRSRLNRKKSSTEGTALSIPKFLNPTESKAMNRNTKQKSLIARRTVRHLLRKHSTNRQAQEADHFSVFESSPDALLLEVSDVRSPGTPDVLSRPVFLQENNDRSLLVRKKTLSRLKTNQVDPSPAVLKRIKNVALHEKYIDHLHRREARRTFVKAANLTKARVTTKTAAGSEQQLGGLKAAKAALFSEARTFIGHFNHMQANSLCVDFRSNVDDDDDNYDDDGEDHDDVDSD